jgi:hypothetical protein
VQRGEAFGFPERRRQADHADDRLRRRRARHLRIWNDLPPTARHPRASASPQADTLDTELTVRENLIIYGRYFGFSRKAVRRPTSCSSSCSSPSVRTARSAALRRHEAASDDRARSSTILKCSLHH